MVYTSHLQLFIMIINYIYQGEVKILQSDLDGFLNVAKKLKIDGLIGKNYDHEDNIYLNDDDQKYHMESSKEYGTEGEVDETVKQESQLRKDSPIQLLLMILLNRQKMGGAAKHVDGPPKLRKLHQFENMLNFTLRVFHLIVSFVTNHSGLEMPCTRINQGVIKKLEVGG